MIDQVELPVSPSCFTYNNRVLAAGILSNVKNHGLNWFINNCTQWEFSVNNKDKSFTIELLKNTPWEISFISEKNYKCFLIKKLVAYPSDTSTTSPFLPTLFTSAINITFINTS